MFQVDNPAVLEAIAFSPDGTRVATGGEEEVVRVFDAADGREHAALFTGAKQVGGLAFSPDGRRLYAAGWEMGGVKVLDPARDPRGRRFPGWRSAPGTPGPSICTGLSSSNEATSTRSAGRPTVAGWPPPGILRTAAHPG